jgi:hypothetical protein
LIESQTLPSLFFTGTFGLQYFLVMYSVIDGLTDSLNGEIIVLSHLFWSARVRTNSEAIQHLGTDMSSFDPKLTVLRARPRFKIIIVEVLLHRRPTEGIVKYCSVLLHENKAWATEKEQPIPISYRRLLDVLPKRGH